MLRINPPLQIQRHIFRTRPAHDLLTQFSRFLGQFEAVAARPNKPLLSNDIVAADSVHSNDLSSVRPPEHRVWHESPRVANARPYLKRGDTALRLSSRRRVTGVAVILTVVE